MDQHLFVFISIGILGCAFGYNSIKWVPLRSGDKLPHKNKLVNISDNYSTNFFVGRARHFDEILPAKVFPNATALVLCCGQNIFKDQFEILTTLDGCEWKEFQNTNIDETALRVGTAWDKEPIYVGLLPHYIIQNEYRAWPQTLLRDYDNNEYVSIYLTSGKTIRWLTLKGHNVGTQKYLSCPMETKWIDASAEKLPNDTVSGGKSEDDIDIYVARLKRDCEIVTGQVVPDIKSATAFLNNGEQIKVDACQVLIGEENEYVWIPASNGHIPDNAVVNGKHGQELSFIARINKTIGHLTYSTARVKLNYEILVSKDLI